MKHRQIDSPVGPLTLVVNDHGVLSGLYFDDQTNRPSEAALGELDQAVAADAVQQLGEYFAGQRSTFDLQISLHGTEFQVQVWEALRNVPFGQSVSYSALAALLGHPHASRAVGAAVGRNPITIIVPCHRVVGSRGALTGYSGGIDRKRWLLDHEAAVAREKWGSGEAGQAS